LEDPPSRFRLIKSMRQTLKEGPRMIPPQRRDAGARAPSRDLAETMLAMSQANIGRKDDVSSKACPSTEHVTTERTRAEHGPYRLGESTSLVVYGSLA